MGKVILFPQRNRISLQAQKMKSVSDELDQLIMHSIDKNLVLPEEMAGLLAHRLGAFLKVCDDRKKLWYICEKVLKNQAIID